MLDTLQDLTIRYSFDSTGFRRHAKHFSPLNAAAFAGRHYLITGGSRGIGAAVAKALLHCGAKVTVTARSDQDFRANFAGINDVSFLALDLADFKAVMSVPLARYDGVVLNAGGMPAQLQVVDDRFDGIFAAQVVGHYLLMRRLIESRALALQAPIHWVSSGGMYLQKLDLTDLSWQQRPYNKVKSYANAKRAQVVLNKYLGPRFKNHVLSCSHPGWVGTGALKDALPGFAAKLAADMRTAEQGADTIVWCLEQGVRLKSGLFWFDRKARATTPFFWTRESEADRRGLLQLLQDVWRRYQPVLSSREMSVY